MADNPLGTPQRILMVFPDDWLNAIEEIRQSLPPPKPETSWMIRELIRRGMPSKARRGLSKNPHRGMKRPKPTPPE